MMPSGTNATTSQRKEEKVFLVIVLALVLVAGIGSWIAAGAFARHDRIQTILPDKERTLGEFSLTDENGWTVTRAELEGKILVVSFLFTSCSLTCSLPRMPTCDLFRSPWTRALTRRRC